MSKNFFYKIVPFMK